MSIQKVVLIIEDQLSIALLLNAKLSEFCNYPILLLKTLAEVEEVLTSDLIPLIALCDLTLPDAPHGETVQLLRKYKVTTIVLTGRYDNATRERMQKELVADYVIKDGPSSIDYVISTAVRLIDNDQREVWILSSVGENTQKLIELLHVQRYKVRVLDSYDSLLETLTTVMPDLLILESIESIKEMKPIKFIDNIRQRYNINELPILACEPATNMAFAIHLMKYGVNDFFNSDFTAEELYVRIHQNIERAEAYRQIELISETDALTGLKNRRFFFEQGCLELKALKSKGSPHFIMMCDIDFFKKINDGHGHQVGDAAIEFVASVMKEVFDGCIIARIGGEEFCIFGSLENKDAFERTVALCKRIEADSFAETGASFTVSIGITFHFEALDQGVGFADKALYESKSNGRNQVSIYTTG